MRTSMMMVLFAAMSAMMLTTLNGVAGQRAGGGVEYDMVTGDGDDAMGGYAQYEIDLDGPIAAQLEVSYVTGDYDVAEGSGDYTIVGLGGALIFSHPLDGFTPYFGAGAANNFNDFDNVDYDDKLSIFFIGGGRVPINEGASLDFSLRYRGLRPETHTLESVEEIDMDAWILRVGLLFEL